MTNKQRYYGAIVNEQKFRASHEDARNQVEPEDPLMDTYSVVGRTVLGILERFAQPATRQSGQGDAESLRSDIAELRTQVETLAQRIDTCISRVDKVTLELYRRLEEPTLPSAATKPEPVQWYTPPKGRVSTKVKERTERVRHAIRELKDAGREFTQVELAKQAGLEYHQLRWILAQNPNLMDP